jgi:hypothetical protein
VKDDYAIAAQTFFQQKCATGKLHVARMRTDRRAAAG